ncbi:MAG: hypothetical protein AB1430_14240 [Pseudomonadota bacterium]
MATALKLAFSLVFGLLTFVLPLPVGGEKLFGEWGRAALFLGLLVGLLLSFGRLDGVPLLERSWRSRRGRRAGLVVVLTAAASVAGYLAMRSAIQVPEGIILWIELISFFAANLSMALLLTAAGAVLAQALMGPRG